MQRILLNLRTVNASLLLEMLRASYQWSNEHRFWLHGNHLTGRTTALCTRLVSISAAYIGMDEGAGCQVSACSCPPPLPVPPASGSSSWAVGERFSPPRSCGRSLTSLTARTSSACWMPHLSRRALCSLVHISTRVTMTSTSVSSFPLPA